MGSRITRRRFLIGLGACAAYLALTKAMNCELLGRTSKLTKSKFYIRGRKKGLADSLNRTAPRKIRA
jgi:hypothetical protein